ncbi:hypothetical protein L6164_021851 [Bauhinia variegata]|uniref:Uncharacterized protein n=1 Tax=Bauhinia variegata TaxID=167791 RepID=A0ACB9MD72_BAUVA|nr:hypothetical protein L6164_021851 [Bauhinia variegata]
MAKRELSSTLRNLKFMQRAALREEKTKKDDDVKPDGNFGTTATESRKCVVLMEGDPHPGALKGRMSFQSFNPSLDKLNEEEERLRQPVAQTISKKSGNMSLREKESSMEGTKYANEDNTSLVVNGDLKRKQSEVISEAQFPNKSPKNDQDGKQSAAPNGLGSFKKPKGDKLDWSVLRPPKCQTK